MHIQSEPPPPSTSQPLPRARLCPDRQKVHLARVLLQGATLWLTAELVPTHCHRPDFPEPLLWESTGFFQDLPSHEAPFGRTRWVCVSSRRKSGVTWWCSKPLRTSFFIFSSLWLVLPLRIVGTDWPYTSLHYGAQVWPKLCQDHTYWLINHHDQLGRDSPIESCTKGILSFH